MCTFHTVLCKTAMSLWCLVIINFSFCYITFIFRSVKLNTFASQLQNSLICYMFACWLSHTIIGRMQHLIPVYCRCSAMLQQLDGPRWREKLPSIPSSSSLSSLATVSSTTDQASSSETTFETCRTEGNTLFSKVSRICLLWNFL